MYNDEFIKAEEKRLYDEYKKQKNKKAALYVSISALFVLLLLVGLILFIVFMLRFPFCYGII